MAAGYPAPPRLWDYTRRQLVLFYREAMRRQRRERAERIEEALAPYQKNVKDILRRLRDDDGERR